MNFAAQLYSSSQISETAANIFTMLWCTKQLVAVNFVACLEKRFPQFVLHINLANKGAALQSKLCSAAESLNTKTSYTSMAS